MEKELEGFEDACKGKIHLDSLKATLIKMQNLKMPGPDDVREYWFKKSSLIPDRHVIEMKKL